MVRVLSHIHGESGSLLVGALLAMLVLASVGLMISLTVAEDMQIARNHIEVVRCLYIAESGLHYALSQLGSDINWPGVASPGVAVGVGYFTVAVSDSSAAGVPLAAGEKRLNVKAYVNSAEREIEVLVR